MIFLPSSRSYHPSSICNVVGVSVVITEIRTWNIEEMTLNILLWLQSDLGAAISLYFDFAFFSLLLLCDEGSCLLFGPLFLFKLLTEQHLEFLSLTGGCRGSSESIHVKMPHCWKSHFAAHICSHTQFCSVLCLRSNQPKAP